MSRSATSVEMETAWSKVETARQRYEAARQRYYLVAAQYDELLKERQHSLIPTPGGTRAVGQAAKAETGARREYMRLLLTFSSLVVAGEGFH